MRCTDTAPAAGEPQPRPRQYREQAVRSPTHGARPTSTPVRSTRPKLAANRGAINYPDRQKRSGAGTPAIRSAAAHRSTECKASITTDRFHRQGQRQNGVMYRYVRIRLPSSKRARRARRHPSARDHTVTRPRGSPARDPGRNICGATEDGDRITSAMPDVAPLGHDQSGNRRAPPTGTSPHHHVESPGPHTAACGRRGRREAQHVIRNLDTGQVRMGMTPNRARSYP
jgi:hypothetical protein